MVDILTVVLMSVLWRLGGSVNKLYRRIGAPVLLLISTTLSGFVWWKAMACAGALCGATFLPITLIGSEEKDNLIWIPLLGQIIGATLIPLTLFTHWWIGLIAMFIMGACHTGLIFLSVFTNYKFKWSWFELIFGTIYGLGIVLL